MSWGRGYVVDLTRVREKSHDPLVSDDKRTIYFTRRDPLYSTLGSQTPGPLNRWVGPGVREFGRPYCRTAFGSDAVQALRTYTFGQGRV
jgi:hypothetical protein